MGPLDCWGRGRGAARAGMTWKRGGGGVTVAAVAVMVGVRHRRRCGRPPRYCGDHARERAGGEVSASSRARFSLGGGRSLPMTAARRLASLRTGDLIG